MFNAVVPASGYLLLDKYLFLKRYVATSLVVQWLRIHLPECREGIFREFGMDMYTLLYLKCITNKDLLYSTWNSTQCFVAVWMGGEFGREWIHVYMYG